MWIVLLVGAFFGQDLYGQCSLTINPATGMLNCKSTGTAGPAGATGPTGPIGPAGATGATGAGLVNCSEAGGQMSCPAGYVSGATAAGAVVTKEASVNGTDAITVGAPDSVSASYRINYPADPPTVAGQALRAGTPGGGITQYTHAVPIWTGTSNPNGYFDWTLGAAPTNPSAGDIRLYPKTGSTLCARDSAGTETCFGSGGGGVKRSLYASIPGTCDALVADTEWIVDDGITSVHCNGSAFQHYYRRLKISPPGPQSGWTLVNSPTEVADIPGGVIYMRDAFHDNPNLKGVLKPMSVGSDWVVQGTVISEGQGYNFNSCGIGIANGNTTAARVLWVGIQHVDASGGSVFVVGYDYTNYTTLGSGTVLGSVPPVTSSGTKSVRITKTGANWTISLSSNGTKFTDIVTEATRFTPTHYGMFCDARGDGSAPGGFAAGTFVSISAQ